MLVAYAHETGVQSWHQFAHLCQVDVANAEGGRLALFLKLHQTFVLRQGDGDFLGVGTDKNFTCHIPTSLATSVVSCLLL